MAAQLESAVALPVTAEEELPGSARMVLASLGRNRVALAGGFVVAAFVLLALVGPWIAPYDPLQVDLLGNLEGPSRAHPFGTDDVGRDVLSRVVVGARTSLLIAVAGVAIALVAGVVLGELAGFYEGALDAVVMRLMDVMLAFPSILLAIVILSMLGPGLASTIVAIGVSSIPSFARLARGSTLAEKHRDYVDAARALGASGPRILAAHVLPNIAAPLIVQASLRMSTMILTAAGLSFIGLGVQPPTPEWGVMVSESRQFMLQAWWYSLFPGVAIAVAVLGFTLVGNGLQAAFNVHHSDASR